MLGIGFPQMNDSKVLGHINQAIGYLYTFQPLFFGCP